MSKEVTKSTDDRIETTIGDLVEAITEIALEAGKTEDEGYKLASLAIERIMRRNSRKLDPEINRLMN